MSDNAGILSLREIAKIIGRSYTAVRAMSSRLSLGLRSNYKPWTREEIVFIKTSAGELSAASVAEKLCRSIDSVKGKARGLGVSLRLIGEKSPVAIYSDNDVNLCCALHEEGLPGALIADKMEIPRHSVYAFINGKRLTQSDLTWRKQLSKS